MKMSNLFKAGALSVLALTALWSCQDDFTEEDLLDKQASLGNDSIDFSIIVYNASTSFVGSAGSDEDESDVIPRLGNSSAGRAKGQASLTVTISKNGRAVSTTTDANGIALFKGLQPGSVVGAVTGAGFTTTNFTVSIKEGESSNGNSEPTTNAGAIIPVFETEGNNVATVTGRATFEGDLLNDAPEPVPNGTKIAFSIDTSSDTFKDLFNAILDLDLLSESVTSASVDNLSFEGTFVAFTTDGAYSINLPTSHHGLDYTYTFSDFTANQSIAINNFENRPFGELRRVESIPTQFSQNNTLTSGPRVDIPFINPVQLVVSDPPPAGSGAVAIASLLPQSITGSDGDLEILFGGSGYPTSQNNIAVQVDHAAGSFDNTVTSATAVQAVLFATSDAQGRITAINTTGPGGTLGFGYKSQATIRIPVPAGGVEAVVRVNYGSTVAPLLSTTAIAGAIKTAITNGGINYNLAPEIYFVGRDFLGNKITEAATGIVVGNGVLLSFGTPGSDFAALPSIVIEPQDRVTARALVNGIGESGRITSIFVSNGGSGYSLALAPSATVTVRHLRAGGSGAQIEPVIVEGGSLSSLTLVNGGFGYSTLNNANFPTSRENFRIEGSLALKLRAGATRVLNAHYGTGVRTLGTDFPD